MNGAVAWSLMKAVRICVCHEHVDKRNEPETTANLSYSIHKSQHLQYQKTSRFVRGTACDYTDMSIVFPQRHVGNSCRHERAKTPIDWLVRSPLSSLALQNRA